MKSEPPSPLPSQSSSRADKEGPTDARAAGAGAATPGSLRLDVSRNCWPSCSTSSSSRQSRQTQLSSIFSSFHSISDRRKKKNPKMTKVHPNVTIIPEYESPEFGADAGFPVDAAVLTVWRKSLLFNCSGFTVYDSKGNLVFRVDNYGPGSKAELVLMDAAGKPLLTVRRKVCLNVFAENWMIYNGGESSKPIIL